ncbi:hypothetical protein [Flavobacterium sp.]|uniref:hypothetical protein n=1 Tax=Flavobacterium sp. TaxID=239 RepID=UPI00286AFAF5|nr:hypothetical protein [Flavobacterium sp.]
MENRLNAIIDNINTKERFLLSVYDLNQGEYLYKYYPAPQILEAYQTGENFFESLKTKGHHFLCIKSHLRRGTGKMKVAEPLTINFNDTMKTEKAHDENTATPLELIPSTAIDAVPMQPKPTHFLDSFGLGAPQVMELMVKKQDAERLTIENSELRADNRSLKEKNENYREEILKAKYDYEKEKDKKNSTHALIGQLAGSLPTIMSYISPMPTADGLNGAKKEEYDSEIKKNFAESIKKLDDDTLSTLIHVVNASVIHSEFCKNLFELLEKYPLPK